MAIPVPMTNENLKDFTPLEYILLVGPGSVGKSNSILSLAQTWEVLHPEGTVYIVDGENGLAKAWKGAYPEVANIQLWQGADTDHIEKVITLVKELGDVVTPEDWLVVESETVVWDLAQDDAWMTVSGMPKDEYISQWINETGGRMSKGAKPVTPDPDKLWQIAGDSYRRRFRDRIKNHIRFRTNVLLTTGAGKKMAPSAAQLDVMGLLGINVTPDGHAEAARNPDTVVLLSKNKRGYEAEVLKDRGMDKPGTRVKFTVEDFWVDFANNCRGGLDG